MANDNTIQGIRIEHDYSEEVIKAMHDKVKTALQAIGQTAEDYAKSECPVDTGRLRNSITYATTNYQSPANTNKHPKGPTDAIPNDYSTKGKPKKDYVYIGTNVEYAPYIEYGDKTHKIGKAHFLKDAACNHAEKYKSIFKAALDS